MKVGAAAARVFILALVICQVEVPAAAAGSDLVAMERRLLSLVNDGRGDARENPSGSRGALLAHWGLVEQARTHARSMLERGSLDHDRLAERVSAAPPDPPEANGAPDDGFAGAYCENVGRHTSSRGAPPADVERSFYEGFRDSGSHRPCLFDENGAGFTAVGIGMVEEVNDRGDRTIYVSMIIVRDDTPPGSSPRNAGHQPTEPAQPSSTPGPQPVVPSDPEPTRDAPAPDIVQDSGQEGVPARASPVAPRDAPRVEPEVSLRAEFTSHEVCLSSPAHRPLCLGMFVGPSMVERSGA